MKTWIFWLLALITATGMATAAPLEHATTWHPWELAFESDRDYVQPSVDLLLRFRCEGPGGLLREGLGFWDGGKRFLIRTAFPLPGRWQWSTCCSDTTNTGLHGLSGEVLVKASRADNPLEKHGYPIVSADGPWMAHADGTPLLWIGDTCWAASVLCNDKDWAGYIANRAGKGYSVLQLAIAPEWALERRGDGPAPFLSTLPDLRQPNPVYFQALDRKIAAANAQGLVVLLVGLMETPYRYPPPDQVALFSRYVAARCNGAAVVLSPSFDSGIHEEETRAAAQAIREAAPANLITMHMGTAVGPRFHNEAWLDFDVYQSGHNGDVMDDDLARAGLLLRKA